MGESHTLFVSGFLIGVLLATAYSVFLMLHQERRHRDEQTLLRRSFDPELQDLPNPKAPIAYATHTCDKDGNVELDFDSPETRRKLRERLDGMRGTNTEWVKHTPYHWTCLLCGDKLQYWPTKNKWRWRHQTYDGAVGDTVELFMQRRIREFYE